MLTCCDMNLPGHSCRRSSSVKFKGECKVRSHVELTWTVGLESRDRQQPAEGKPSRREWHSVC